MKRLLTFKNLLLGIIFALALTACEKEGPAERAGEKIDQAVEEAKEEVRQTKEKIEDSVKE